MNAGSSLGPYRIQAKLGEGGMGEVYRALDPRLGREVAIKVLPDTVASDSGRLARFEREAQAVAALSHPNILSIHEFGSASGIAYAVMELLSGETLRERLAAGRLPLRKVIDYGTQIAKGLAAAHAKGIVHRDLKPENIFLTADGQLKLLDFGLSRSLLLAASPNGQTATLGTEPGMIMGTVGYMSPEQVRAETDLDHRSDIFSLGAVLYEMLSGRRAFSRPTAAETMTAILKDDPPELTDAGLPVSPALEDIVRHCLEKRPEERFQSARDLAFALQHAGSGTMPSTATPWSPRRRLPWKWPVAIVAAAAAAYLRGRASVRPVPASEWQRASFTAVTTTEHAEWWPNLSADGRLVAFAQAAAGNMDVYVQRIGGHNATNLTADSPDADDQPVFSADGTQIAFRSTRQGGGIFVMGATGESVRRVADFGHTPAWSPDGRFLAVSSIPFTVPGSRPGIGKLSVIALADGSRRELPTADAVQPSWSPDGTRIAYWGRDESGVRDLWTIAADGSAAPVPATADTAVDWSPVWGPGGRFLYFSSDRGGTMNVWRLAIDQRTGVATGAAEPVTVPSRMAGNLSLSADGKTLVYATSEVRTTLSAGEFDAAAARFISAPQAVLEGGRELDYVDLSPDGRWIAFGSSGRQEDVFLVRTDGTGYRQLTDDMHRDRGPRWSPDGSRLAFYSNRSGPYAIWTIRPDGSGLALVGRAAENSLVRPAWTPDGERIAAMDGETGEVVIMDVAAAGGVRLEKVPAISPFALIPGAWSPDGRFLAGTAEIGPGTKTVLLYSLDGRARPVHVADVPVSEGAFAWLGDSRRLLFTTAASGIMLLDTGNGSVRDVLPKRRGVNWIAFLTKARNASTVAFVERRIESDLWMMRRE